MRKKYKFLFKLLNLESNLKLFYQLNQLIYYENVVNYHLFRIKIIHI